MVLVTKVAPIISYFFLLRQKERRKKKKKERQSLSVSSFSAHSLSHPTVTVFPTPHPLPHNSGHPFPAVWMHYLETSIARAFQDGVRLLSCHVALTRVHDRFQTPSATSPSTLISTPILRRLSMVQDYVHLPREIYFSVSVTLLPLPNPIEYNFYSLNHLSILMIVIMSLEGQCVKEKVTSFTMH